MGLVVAICWVSWPHIVSKSLLQVVHKTQIKHPYHYDLNFVFLHIIFQCPISYVNTIVSQPYLGECEDETHTPEIWDLGVLRDSRNFKVRLQGSKHFAFRCFLYHWKAIEV
jgi:hypothetical protein